MMVEVIAAAAETAAEVAEAAAEVAEATAEVAEVGTEAAEVGAEAAEVGTEAAGELGYFSPETQGVQGRAIDAVKEKAFEQELPSTLEACNPNYELGEEWKINCQRCVPTYEMRKRGYDVTAKPCLDMNDYLSYNPWDVWKNAEVIQCEGTGLDQITKQMAEWGNGARCQITVSWKGGGGHTFVAEQVNGKTRIFDPQTHGTDVTSYFNRVVPGSVQFWRIDNLAVNENMINLCCQPAGV